MPSYGSWRHDSNLNEPTSESYAFTPRKPPPSRRSGTSASGLPGWLVTGIIVFIMLMLGVTLWAFKGGGDINSSSSSLADMGPPDSSQYRPPAATGKPDAAVPVYPEPVIEDTSSNVAIVEEETAKEEQPEPELTFSERLLISTFLLINVERAEYGLNDLTPDELLTNLAQEHSVEMVQYNYFSHDRVAGSRDMMWGNPTWLYEGGKPLPGS